MEIQQHFPQDMQKIIFHYVDYKSKQNLVFTCRSFLKVAEEYLKEQCSFDNFVDKLYAVPSVSRVFKFLSNNCNDEYKISLINYFLISGARPENDARDPRGQWIREGIDKKELLNQCLQVNKFDIVFRYITQDNKKKHVKYYIDYSNVAQCIKLLAKDLGIEGYQDMWSAGKKLEQWMEEYNSMKCVVSDICSFFDKETTFNNFAESYNKIVCNEYSTEQIGKDIIKALDAKKFSVLVFLRMCAHRKNIERDFQWINSFFDNAQEDDQRKLLAKACYGSRGLNLRFVAAVKNLNCDKAKCYLEVMIDQGYDFNHEDNKIENLLKNIFAINLSEMLPALFQAGLQISTSDIKKLDADQIRQCVKVGYGLYGEDFWIKGDNYYFLYQAVLLKNAELVEYLLNHKANTNRKRCDNKQPIFYALNNNNDDVFRLLLPKTNLSIQDLNQNINVELFKDYPQTKEDNVLQLIKKCLDPSKISVSDNFIIQNMYNVMFAAIVSSKDKIVEYLLEVITWPDDKKKAMLECAIKHYKSSLSIVDLLLKKNAHQNGVAIDRAFRGASINLDKELLLVLINAGVNLFDIDDNDAWSAILSVMNTDDEIIKYYDIHKDKITETESQRFLSYVIQKERCDVVKYLLDNGVKHTSTKISSSSIDGDFNKIKNEDLKLLLFKDLVTQNKNDDDVLRFLLDYAIKNQNVAMVNAVLVHHKNINNFECQILSNWSEKKNDCSSKNAEIQTVLQIYRRQLEQLEQQEKLYKEKIDEHVEIINKNKMGDISPINRSAGESSGGIFSLSDDEKKAYDSIIFLAEQLLNNQQNTYLRNKIQEINIVWIDNIYARCSNGTIIMKAMEVLSKINDNLRELTDQEKEARNNLRKKIMNGQDFKVAECEEYFKNIHSVCNRPMVDKELRKDMLCALGKQIQQCIYHLANEGVSVSAEGDFIVWDVNKVPSSGSKEEDLFFELLKALVKIDNVKQDKYNLLEGYEAKKNKYKDEIQQTKMVKLVENNSIKVVNNQNSSFGLGTIKDIVSSFFTQFLSFLQCLNPFKFIFG